MRISICLPVKGRPRFLRQALHSILLQGHEDVELVIKDADGVTLDENIDVLLNLLPRVNCDIGPDGGIFPAVNDCLRRATGQILYFMCSDDLLCPGALEAVNAEFERERFGGPFWVYGKTISADATGRTLGIDGAPTTYEKLLGHNRLGQPAVFWNRQLMSLAGRFDLRYRHAADYELWLRFWARVEPMFLDQTLGIFRHHAEQNTSVQSRAVEAEAQRISQRHRNFGNLIMRSRNVLTGGQVLETVN